MPTPKIPIQNQQELKTLRSGAIHKGPGITQVNDGTTGQQTASTTHHGGANLTYSMQTTSEFNPNDRQTLTQGKHSQSTKGDHFVMSQGMMELRSYGDLNLISGSPAFFDTAAADKIVEIRGEIAAKMAAPEIAVGGKLNNSGTEFKPGGSVDPKSGSSQGMSFPPSPERKDLPKFLEEQQKKLTPLEASLGVGGNINFLSCKHLTFAAGSAPSTFDSAFVNPVGRKVSKGTTFKQEGDKPYGGKYEPEEKGVPQVEEKATATGMPFGNIQFKAGNGLNLESGAGGVNLTTGGSARMTSKAVTMLHGIQTIITGSGGISMRAPYTEIQSDQVNVQASNTHVASPLTTIVGDVVIQGNVYVEKNLTVTGDIYCQGLVQVAGNIISDGGDVRAESGDHIAQGWTLKTHIHPDGAGPKTSAAIPG